MAEAIKIEDIEERVVLIGVSEQDGDDAEDSVEELKELVKTDHSCRKNIPDSGRHSKRSCCHRYQEQHFLQWMNEFHRRRTVEYLVLDRCLQNQ